MTREEKKAATRAKILTEARFLFNAHGYCGFTMAQLAYRCRISVGAIYLHFDSDVEIYAEMMAEDLDGLTAESALDVIARYMPAELAAVL